MPLLRVADVTLDFQFPHTQPPESDADILKRRLDNQFPKFLTDAPTPPLQTHFLTCLDDIPPDTPMTDIVYEDPHLTASVHGEETHLRFSIPAVYAQQLQIALDERAYGDVYISSDWSEVRMLEYTRRHSIYTRRYRFRQAFEGFLPLHGSFVFHAAAVLWNGRGLLFTGPSGAGKTTHSGLWVSHAGASILNGDSPILSKRDGRLIIRGSPWCGTSRQSLNADAPLDAIVVLRQGDHNKMRLLPPFEASLQVLAGLRRPEWSKPHLNLALRFLDEILASTPVYELVCLPEPGAVDEAIRVAF